MKKKPRIAVVSTSLAEKSRSRIAARFMYSAIKKLGATVDWIDLQADPLPGYPLGSSDKKVDALCKLVTKADALVLAFPIYNWSESGQTRDFLAYVLDKKTMKNKICLLIAGCSTRASFLAPMSVSRTLQGEIGAVMIGPGILACGDDVDRENGTIKPELQARLDHGAELVVRLASA